ncbi:ABC-2 type transport system permease protein [Caldanaerobius fijiensis DSM 17918]|uniref:ABC-2 type transport system permease protein n=1 Tax=Caldanaerobius fijiensis DSM 17918 TaxID=1121256 RepID=A0A1M4SR91_9THEO|nr:ABC-2 type transport system permease protein [Caldanaerobius fijiensis DSM 17918]
MNRFKKYWVVFSISISNNLVYLTNFISGNIFVMFILFIYVNLWSNIYKDKSVISGFTFKQLLWYLFMTEVISLAKTDIFKTINTDVKNGNIAYLINKPYNYIFYNYFNAWGEIILKTLTNIIAAGVLTYTFVGPLKVNIAILPVIALSMFMSISINFFITTALSLTSFWFEENTAFFWIYTKLIFIVGGMLIPIEMFPGWLKAISLKLPFAYVTYGPAKLLVSFDPHISIEILSYQLVYLLTFMFLSIYLFKLGSRCLNVNGG